jgi:hypothetical protein
MGVSTGTYRVHARGNQLPEVLYLFFRGTLSPEPVFHLFFRHVAVAGIVLASGQAAPVQFKRSVDITRVTNRCRLRECRTGLPTVLDGGIKGLGRIGPRQGTLVSLMGLPAVELVGRVRVLLVDAALTFTPAQMGIATIELRIF